MKCEVANKGNYKLSYELKFHFSVADPGFSIQGKGRQPMIFEQKLGKVLPKTPWKLKRNLTERGAFSLPRKSSIIHTSVSPVSKNTF